MALALFILLLCAPDRCATRNKLAGLLWPELEEEKTRELLCSALKVLYQVLTLPHEEQPTLASGHAQVFTPEKLQAWGRWCVKPLEGKGTMRCEALEGGLLLIERMTG